MRDIKLIRLSNRVCMSYEDFDKLMGWLERLSAESDNERTKTEVAELFLKLVGTGAFAAERESELYEQDHKKYINSAARILKSI